MRSRSSFKVGRLTLTRLAEAVQAFTGAHRRPKTRPPHSPEFRRQMVDLVRAGRDPEELTREFEPTSLSIRDNRYRPSGRSAGIERLGAGHGKKQKMATRRTAVVCAGLASVVAVLGCVAQQQQSLPTDAHASRGAVTMSSYDETAYYNAVRNRWFGLGDYATDQPGR
jgi:transposase